MSTRRRRTAAGVFTSVAAALHTHGCGGGGDAGRKSADELDPSTVAARVNGVAIRAGSVEEQYAVALVTFQGAKSATADESGRAAVRAQMLGGLIQFALLEQAAAERGLEVEQADLDAQRAALTAMGGGEAAYAKRVEGMPPGEIDQQLRQAVLEDKLMAALAADVVVPDVELETFYQTNSKTRFGPSVIARHILVADEAAASAVLDRLSRGEDFAAVAADVSLDVATAENGGQLGTVRRGMTPAPVEKALFAAAPGTVIGPVLTEPGFEIMQVTRRQGSRPFEGVRDEIHAELALDRGRSGLAELIARKAAAAEVSVNDAFGRWAPDQGIVLPPREGG